jgi:hypothetical protein
MQKLVLDQSAVLNQQLRARTGASAAAAAR